MTIKLTPEGDLIVGTVPFHAIASAAELRAAGLQRVGADECVVKREPLEMHTLDLDGAAEVCDQYPEMAPSAAEFRRAASELRALLNAKEERG